jgi:hypothetical protein
MLDTIGNYLHGEESCDECIEVEMEFEWPESVALPAGMTTWTPENNYGYDILCQYWDGTQWSTTGID